MNELNACKRCKLGHQHVNREKLGLWRTMRYKKVLFLGINPSYLSQRDLWNDPFGRYFLEQLQVAGIDYTKIAFTNIVKCSTDYNAAVSHASIKACDHWLNMELKDLDPKLIVCLGRIVADQFNVQYMYAPEVKNGIKYIAVYHPSFIEYKASKEAKDKYYHVLKKIAHDYGLKGEMQVKIGGFDGKPSNEGR
jgi:DNA polymerase